jgi:predicted transcriptional regulator
VKSNTKSPEQAEFTELADELREKFGYNQNRVAKVCRIKPGMVSMVLSGKRNPGDSALELLRIEHAALTNPTGRKAIEREKDEITEQISFLKENAPAAYKAARLSVAALHKMALCEASSKGKESEADRDRESTEESAKKILDMAAEAVSEDSGKDDTVKLRLPNGSKDLQPRAASGLTRKRRSERFDGQCDS